MAGGGSKIGAALGFGPMPDEEPPVSEVPGSMDAEAPMDPESDEMGGQEAEIHAMKLFEKATTPQGKVAALKGFLSACGLMDY